MHSNYFEISYIVHCRVDIIHWWLNWTKKLVASMNKALVEKYTAALYLLGVKLHWITLKSLCNHCNHCALLCTAVPTEFTGAEALPLPTLWKLYGPQRTLLRAPGDSDYLLPFAGLFWWSVPTSELACIWTKGITSLLTGRLEITASLHSYAQRKVPSNRVNLERKRC
jgi:hypothetical protein